MHFDQVERVLALFLIGFWQLATRKKLLNCLPGFFDESHEPPPNDYPLVTDKPQTSLDVLIAEISPLILVFAAASRSQLLKRRLDLLVAGERITQRSARLIHRTP